MALLGISSRGRGYRLTYQSRNPLAATNPLRSIPLFRPAAYVFGASWSDGTWNKPKAASAVVEAPVARAPVDPAHELADAEAALREAIRVYDAARREIGAANRTRTEAVVAGGRVVMPALPFTPERIRERKSAAFHLFNQRRSQLAAAKRRVAAARIALGMPVEASKAVKLPCRCSRISAGLSAGI